MTITEMNIKDRKHNLMVLTTWYNATLSINALNGYRRYIYWTEVFIFFVRNFLGNDYFVLGFWLIYDSVY